MSTWTDSLLAAAAVTAADRWDPPEGQVWARGGWTATLTGPDTLTLARPPIGAGVAATLVYEVPGVDLVTHLQ